jgi:hypothetical protein
MPRVLPSEWINKLEKSWENERKTALRARTHWQIGTVGNHLELEDSAAWVPVDYGAALAAEGHKELGGHGHGHGHGHGVFILATREPRSLRAINTS